MKCNYNYLAEFIYRPSYLCHGDELRNDIINLVECMDDDPETVIDIIAGHQYVANQLDRNF